MGPEGVLAHHLSLGVTMAGVQTVGPASHRVPGCHRGVTEDISLVACAQALTHAPGQPRVLTPLASLTVVIQAPAGTLPDASETQEKLNY